MAASYCFLLGFLLGAILCPYLSQALESLEKHLVKPPVEKPLMLASFPANFDLWSNQHHPRRFK